MDFEISIKNYEKNIVPYLNKIMTNKIINKQYDLMIGVVSREIINCYRIICKGKSKILITPTDCPKEIESKLKKLTEN